MTKEIPGPSTPYPELVMPEDVEKVTIKIWSQGIALDADIYRPKNLTSNDKLPAIICSHGWGGDKESANRYAALFASEGFVALTFTQSNWGNSGCHLVYSGEKPELDDNAEAVVKVRFVEKLISPLNWVANYKAAVDYIVGEKNVDVNRIGAWGTSFGAGVVLFSAGIDSRIKVISTQVGSMPSPEGPMGDLARLRATEVARGITVSYPTELDKVPPFDGSLDFANVGQYDVMEKVNNVKVPCQIIAAENEEFFSNEEHGERAYAILQEKSGSDCHYEVIPEITHYGVYFDGYDKSSRMALSWFREYL